MVMEVVAEETMSESSMQCSNHPYKNTTGICAFCLQEKLGKLVSSSFSSAVFPFSSSSPSPTSFRSQFTHQNGPNDRTPRLPFVLTKDKKNIKDDETNGRDPTTIVFKRSKSIAAQINGQDYSSHRRGFWSFLYTTKHSTPKQATHHNHLASREDIIDETSFDRKVSRSRSVGCGSRSFSGDFFERISTGFGDCTLRRVESQGEGRKPNAQQINGQDCTKQRVSCGGIFSGFMVNSSSSSLSSTYWVASAVGRSKSRGWTFASPMRVFGSKTSASKTGKNNTSPNLAAIPSLLSANG